MSSMSETDPHIPQGYLHHALTEGLKMATTFLDSTHTNTREYATTPPTLIAALDGSHILSHIRKDSSSQITNYVIFMANYNSYAMLATTDTPVKIRLPTSITIAGSHHQKSSTYNSTPITQALWDGPTSASSKIPSPKP
jgi:hypothetical protein